MQNLSELKNLVTSLAGAAAVLLSVHFKLAGVAQSSSGLAGKPATPNITRIKQSNMRALQSARAYIDANAHKLAAIPDIAQRYRAAIAELERSNQ